MNHAVCVYVCFSTGARAYTMSNILLLLRMFYQVMYTRRRWGTFAQTKSYAVNGRTKFNKLFKICSTNLPPHTHIQTLCDISLVFGGSEPLVC